MSYLSDSSQHRTDMRASYGSWKSPITTELITAGGIKLSEAMGYDGRVFWIEGQPSDCTAPLAPTVRLLDM